MNVTLTSDEASVLADYNLSAAIVRADLLDHAGLSDRDREMCELLQSWRQARGRAFAELAACQADVEQQAYDELPLDDAGFYEAVEQELDAPADEDRRCSRTSALLWSFGFCVLFWGLVGWVVFVLVAS